MKASRILMSVFALAALVGCSQNHEENEVVGGGEVEKSYLSVNVKSSEDLSRAIGDYEDGTEEEKKVTNAHFFFFDAAGDPVSVSSDKNYIAKTISDDDFDDEGTAKNTIESVGQVLVLDKTQGPVVSQLVVVLNWAYNGASMNLSKLKGQLVVESALKSANGFVMSNSVWMNSDKSVKDTALITSANLAESAKAAEDNPVTVYVERLAARVKVNTGEGIFDPGVEAAGEDVKVKILGWDLIATQPNTKLVKAIDTSWTNDALGFAWNNAANFRSHWAVPETATVNNAFTYEQLTNKLDAVEYCGEHVGVKDDVNNTKVVFAAQLVADDGSGTLKPLELAQWYGAEYAGTGALLAAVAPTLKNELMHMTEDAGVKTYTSIDDSQIQCVAGLPGTDSYEVSFQLAEGVPTDDWYRYDGAKYHEVTDVNAVLAAIDPALVYKDGKTYYSVDIKHYGDKAVGVIRNHSYTIKVTGVNGLGTPVYNPNSNIVKPAVPKERYTYLESEINVLAWSLVEQEAVLGQ